MTAVAPSDRDDGETVAADDGLQGEFHGDVEMRREDGADAVDDFFAVGFEGVGRVVQAVTEKESHEGVGQTVHEELDRRIVDSAAALHEAAAEDAVVAFVELVPVADDIAGVVGVVGHEDDGGVAGHGVETEGDGTAEAVRAGVLHAVQNAVTAGGSWARALLLGDPTGRRGAWRRGIQALGFFLEDLPSAVRGAVVDDDDFVRDAAEVQLEMQVLDGGRDAAFLITRGDDDGQELEWRVGSCGSREGHCGLLVRVLPLILELILRSAVR